MGYGSPSRFRISIVLALGLVLATVSGCSKKVATGPETTPSPDRSEHVLEHTVVQGESLSQIADNYYGDPERFEDIARLNGVQDPGKIVPGSVLRLEFTGSEWASAERRAAALVPYNQGVDDLAQGRLADAEKQFRLALETAPDLAAAQYNLALVLLKRGKTDEALVLLQELAAKRPEDIDFLFAYGNGLFQATRFADAAEQFQAAVALDPTFKRAAYGLARSLQESDQTTAAIAAWNRYLELDGESSWARSARRNLEKLQDETQR